MKNLELYDLISETLNNLSKDEMDIAKAKEVFNGCGKLIALTKLQFQFIEAGLPVEVPMFGYDAKIPLNGNSRKAQIINQIKEVQEKSEVLETN